MFRAVAIRPWTFRERYHAAQAAHTVALATSSFGTAYVLQGSDLAHSAAPLPQFLGGTAAAVIIAQATTSAFDTRMRKRSGGRVTPARIGVATGGAVASGLALAPLYAAAMTHPLLYMTAICGSSCALHASICGIPSYYTHPSWMDEAVSICGYGLFSYGLAAWLGFAPYPSLGMALGAVFAYFALRGIIADGRACTRFAAGDVDWLR